MFSLVFAVFYLESSPFLLNIQSKLMSLPCDDLFIDGTPLTATFQIPHEASKVIARPTFFLHLCHIIYGVKKKKVYHV